MLRGCVTSGALRDEQHPPGLCNNQGEAGDGVGSD